MGVGGTQEEDGHLNKIICLGKWEWMLSKQLGVYDTHLLDCKPWESRGYIFSYYCTPSM